MMVAVRARRRQSALPISISPVHRRRVPSGNGDAVMRRWGRSFVTLVIALLLPLGGREGSPPGAQNELPDEVTWPYAPRHPCRRRAPVHSHLRRRRAQVACLNFAAL